MDPNATLATLRRLTISLEHQVTYGVADWDDMQELAGELAQTIAALDDWLSKGGFLPDEWKQQQPKTFTDLQIALRDEPEHFGGLR